MRDTTGVQFILTEAVQRILAGHAIACPMNADDDLTKVGMTSIDMVNLMLTVESAFDLTIPPAQINPRNFRSIASITAMVEQLAVG